MSEKPLRLLTISEVADMFRVSKATVYRMIESRLIPFYKISRAIRFSEDDVIAYLESQRVKPKSEWFFEAPHKSHPRKSRTNTDKNRTDSALLKAAK